MLTHYTQQLAQVMNRLILINNAEFRRCIVNHAVATVLLITISNVILILFTQLLVLDMQQRIIHNSVQSIHYIQRLVMAMLQHTLPNSVH